MKRALIAFLHMLSYKTALERLFHSRKVKNLQQLNFPELTFPSIHVAGSNGKGSVCTKIAKTLELAGLKVGLYTSPHILSFHERIRINEKQISEEDVLHGLNRIYSLCDALDVQATFFEMTTFLAFDYFRRKQVDIAVIETGLGGRCDATNVITPILSIITSISLEHVHVLGDTLEKIAYEKAGIIKPGVPVILGPKANLGVILNIAQQMRSPVLQCTEVFPFYDEENSHIAKIALQYLSKQFAINEQIIEEGLKVRPFCRFESLGDLIFDVAHNPDAFARLIDALNIHYPSKPFHMLIGMSNDKDLQGCLKIASRHAEHIYLVRAQDVRAASVDTMAKHLEDENYFSFSTNVSIEEAHQRTQIDGRLLVICGSFYMIAEAKSLPLTRSTSLNSSRISSKLK